MSKTKTTLAHLGVLAKGRTCHEALGDLDELRRTIAAHAKAEVMAAGLEGAASAYGSPSPTSAAFAPSRRT